GGVDQPARNRSGSGRTRIGFTTVKSYARLSQTIDTFRYLRDLRDRRNLGAGWRELVDWYLNQGSGKLHYKLKAAVPSFIKAVSEPCMFRANVYHLFHMWGIKRHG